MKFFIKVIFLGLLIGFSFQSYAAYAQDSAQDIVPLDEMLNPDMLEKKEKPKVPTTAADYGNFYFEQCINEDDPIFTPSEKEILCGCTAAKMTELLPVSDFRILNQDSKAGRTVRQNVLLYAYAPCMPYVIQEYARKDCLRSEQTQNIGAGRESICRCVGQRVDKEVAMTAIDLIEIFNMEHPEKIDFLKYYFMGPLYESTRWSNTKQCIYEQSYSRHN
tara:strand:+ start:1315 stop:1971 length:657 start_codon:yes stop_codon:yes gene_type:complete